MPEKIIHLFHRIPQAPRAKTEVGRGRQPAAGSPGHRTEALPHPGVRHQGQGAAFPPICLIEPLSPTTKGALQNLLKGEFDSSHQQSDYRVQIRNLGNLHLTVLLVECPTVSILTLLDADTGAAFSAGIQAGDYPDLESLLLQLSKLAARGQQLA